MRRDRNDGTTVKSPFYHPLLIPYPVDARSALFRLNQLRRWPPRPRIAACKGLSAAGLGLSAAGLGTTDYSSHQVSALHQVNKSTGAQHVVGLETIPTRHRRELPRRRAAPGSRIRQQIVNFSCTSGFLLVAIKGGSRYHFWGEGNERKDEHPNRTTRFHAA